MTDKHKYLGRGLNDLLDNSSHNANLDKHNVSQDGYISDLNINLIERNPYQPRMNPEDGIDELVSSIKESGVISPLIVAKFNDKYILIAGERRLSAAKLAQLKTVPVIVKNIAGKDFLEVAIIENIQRKDLNPLEEAIAFKQLKDEFGLTIIEIAKKLGISQASINKKMSILSYPERLQILIAKGELSEEGASFISKLAYDKDMLNTCIEISIKNSLSAKQIKALVEKFMSGSSAERLKKIRDEYSANMETSITHLLGRKIYFSRTKNGGKIIVKFSNDEDLEKLYSRLKYIDYHI